jgi:glutathione S-transferase
MARPGPDPEGALMHRIHGDMRSGNCYKIKLLMRFLDIEHDWRHAEVLAGEIRTPEFMEKNRNAKIPLLSASCTLIETL